MASPEAIGTAVCLCGSAVHVCKNSGGFPYFRCGACGVEVRHHRHSAAGKFLREKVTIFEPEAPLTAPEKHEVPPAAKPAPKSTFSTLMG